MSNRNMDTILKTFLLFLSLVYKTIYVTSKTPTQDRYSSIQCVGGSQLLETQSLNWAMRQGNKLSKFPLNDPEHRACLLRNVCFSQGNLTYFVTAFHNSIYPKDYLPEGFNGNVVHTGHLRGFTVPIQTQVGLIPLNYEWSNSSVAFFDANSWSFNYGHYLIDNVIPTFIATKLFNFPYRNIQQVFETKCRLFSVLEEGFSRRRIDYNKSLGSYQDGCLKYIQGFAPYFFDHNPLFVDELISRNLCFRRLMIGQGSAFGLKSVDLTRAMILREFRDYVVKRNRLDSTPLSSSSGNSVPHRYTPSENLILVGMRTAGAAGGAIINNLCQLVKEALEKYESLLETENLGEISKFNKLRKFVVACIIPSEMSFFDEIKYARKSKIIITLHGTISYLSLFSRDGTQQISIADPKEYKENQILLYATHTQLHYLTWDRLHELYKILTLAITNSNAYYYER